MVRHKIAIKTGQPRSPLSLILAFTAGVLCIVLLGTGVNYTNTQEFCVSCHSMTFSLEEFKKTIHFKNPSGVQARCPDCHVPKELIPQLKAKIMAAPDVIHELLGTMDTRKKFEQRRWGLANRVWDKMEANNSMACRSCHALAQMDLEGQDKSARKRHARAESEGKTCINCHKGIAHQEPQEPEEPEEETPDNRP